MVLHQRIVKLPFMTYRIIRDPLIIIKELEALHLHLLLEYEVAFVFKILLLLMEGDEVGIAVLSCKRPE
ncbi:MAG: hypothetical protein WAM14_16080 [Candidatus Nitrosopolaris sp.]